MLYLVATPIGNLGDITLRAIETLRACDAVYCEDTRRTAQLMNHLGIEKPLYSCHTHNERMRSVEIIAALREGKELAYVSDAGMPGVSDPGAILAQACVENSLPYTVVPGASAVLTAAVLSGLPPQPFSFFGFLPRETKPRRELLDTIANTPHLCLLYESPHRVRASLQDLCDRLGDVRAAVLRELTKKFESVYRGRLSELIELFAEEPKGECVIAVLPEPSASSDAVDPNACMDVLLETLSVKDAAAAAAERLHIPKKQAYALALERKALSDAQSES
ncbi:MAG: 16S rRNA (cytidine(1402)-2'-O)-methyltransferase [Clostridia bacterium]|nr:16S rRNA (cytidine(1402)-2'-O)-methyltransferase [Clostridia bacterium]